jgi:hypothetical protein
MALFVGWVAFVIAEMARPSVGAEYALPTILQGVALAVVFAGYAIGWRAERTGGILVLAGTAVYFAIVLAATQALPGVATLWFAAPGVLYLLARHYDHHESAEPMAA